MQGLAFDVSGVGRPGGRRGKTLRDAALADERHPHDAGLRRGRFTACRRSFHVPAWRFVTARRTEQRHTAVAEVQQRIVPVQAADELPHLSANPPHHSRSLGMPLHRIRSHDCVPLQVLPLLSIETPPGVSPIRLCPFWPARTGQRSMLSATSREMPPERYQAELVVAQIFTGCMAGCRPSRALRNSPERQKNTTVGRINVRSPDNYRSCTMARRTKPTFAGRSPSRRMKYGNHCRPNGR